MLIQVVRRTAHILGLEVTRSSSYLSDLSPAERRIVHRARPYTQTSLDRIAALIKAVDYVVHNRIPGAFVECGVWKGGSSMAAALAFMEFGAEDIDFFLFDTFAGMPAPGEKDVQARTGRSASEMLANSLKWSEVKAYASIEEARRNIESTGYPAGKLHFVPGMVEETIPKRAPEQIAILRLDTDWYSSTKHELVHLYPRLSRDGVLIIDDYGHWKGAKEAVDEYFAQKPPRPLLNRIDYSGRVSVKL